MRIDLVLGGSASVYLAKSLADELGAEFSHIETRRFPDGESYVRIPVDVSGRSVAIVQSMYRTPNEYLVDFVLAAKTARELGARELVAVIPYVPYMRQDSRFKPGEAVSAGIFADLMRWAGVDALVTVDMHLHRIEDPSQLFNIKVVNASASLELAKKAFSLYGLDPAKTVMVAPDEEAEQWVKPAAEALGTPYFVLTKERLGDEEVVIRGEVDIAGKDLLIIDDIISTGTTIAEASKYLLSKGAKRVYVACTHALLVSGAEAKIYGAGVKGIVATDTVPNPYAVVPTAPIIARAIRE